MSLSRRAFVITGSALLLAGCSAAGVPGGATTPGQLTVEAITSAINSTRKANNQAPFAYNQDLARAAKTHANLMAARDEISHTLGGTLRERVTEAGYRGAVGENLAAGQKTLEAAIADWLTSPGHRSTLLSGKFKEFGLAASRSGKGRVYWAMIAGGPFTDWY
jgi:uncharacterized protein YkwD